MLVSHEVLLEVDLGCPVGFGRRDAGGDGIVADRQQRQLDPEAGSNLAGHLRQGCALAASLRTEQVQRKIQVAELEPVLPAEPSQLSEHTPGLAGPAPAGLGVDLARERVGDRVEIGADVEAVQREVVADVHDRGDIGGPADAKQSAEEPGGADAAG